MDANKLKEALEITGYEKCTFGPDKDPCEECGTPNQQLYFGDRDYWDAREGKYLCAHCVIALKQYSDQLDEHIRSLNIGPDGEPQTTSETLDTRP